MSPQFRAHVSDLPPDFSFVDQKSIPPIVLVAITLFAHSFSAEPYQQLCHWLRAAGLDAKVRNIELNSVLQQLGGPQATAALQPLLDAISVNRNSKQALEALGASLNELTGRLEGEEVTAALRLVGDAPIKSDNLDEVSVLADGLNGLSLRSKFDGDRSAVATTLVDLLRHPLLNGHAREATVSLLEQLAGDEIDFHGDTWHAVSWILAEQKEGRLTRIDLEATFRSSGQ